MKRRGVLAITVAAITTLGLAGCGPTNAILVSGHRTLLTHASTGASADALLDGTLGANREGCVSVGTAVLDVPDGSQLFPDGSIRVDGQTYRPGATIKLGGGFGASPADSVCGARSQYFWVG